MELLFESRANLSTSGKKNVCQRMPTVRPGPDDLCVEVQRLIDAVPEPRR
jgi:hypothetical protein